MANIIAGHCPESPWELKQTEANAGSKANSSESFFNLLHLVIFNSWVIHEFKV